MATIETTSNNVNMLHRKTLAFKWQLQLLANGNPIDLSSIQFIFTIIDRRGIVIKTATNGVGLLISNDKHYLIFDVPVADLDTLTTAHKYILVREQGIEKIPIIQGDFNVVDTYHNPNPKTNIIGNATLIQTSILSGQTIQITGCQFISNGGSSSWGGITGNIANQTDLQNALNAKYDINNPNGYQTAAQVAAAVSAKYDASNPANYQSGIQVDSKINLALNPYSTITYADAREAAAKAYADQLVVGLLDDRGNYNASTNVFPSTGGSGVSGAILKGDLWTVSVAGTLGGVAVTPGDLVRALVDTPGQTASNWAVSETNIGYTAENVSNKSTSIAADQGSNTKYPSVKSVFDWATSVFTTAGAVATQIAAALVGYATQSWVTSVLSSYATQSWVISQGYITNVISALGFTPAQKGQVDYIGVLLQKPSNGTYRLTVRMPFSGTITETSTICDSGTCTALVLVNSTPLGANAVSNSPNVVAQTQSFAVGDVISVVIGSSSACTNMSLNIRYNFNLQ